MFAPFVPFIVLFCQVIETRDITDLGRLEAFVASLQPHRSVADAVDRLRRLFQILYSVASQYVESQTGAGKDDQQTSTEVDACLATLGFPSQPGLGQQQESGDLSNDVGDTSDQTYQRGFDPMIWMGNGTQLENWFYNNEQMMTFLDDTFPNEERWGATENEYRSG